MNNWKSLALVVIMAGTLLGCSTTPVEKFSDRIAQTPSSLVSKPTCIATGVGEEGEYLPEAYLNNTGCLGEYMNSFDALIFFEDVLFEKMRGEKDE